MSNAHKFVAAYGTERAKAVFDSAPDGSTHFLYDSELMMADYLKHMPNVSEFSFDLWCGKHWGWKPFLRTKKRMNLAELKQVVDSLELIINDFESVEIAEYEYMICGSQNEPYWVRLKQAIADHEYVAAIKKVNGYGGIGMAKLIEQSVYGESLDLSKAISDHEAGGTK